MFTMRRTSLPVMALRLSATGSFAQAVATIAAETPAVVFVCHVKYLLDDLQRCAQ